MRQHGTCKRRTWRKVHLAVDPYSHAIVARLLTNSGIHKSDAVETLLKQVDNAMTNFYGNGAYDPWKLRDYLHEAGICQIIPARKDAVIKQHGNCSADPIELDECIRQIKRDGREAWEESIDYQRRSFAETAVSRMKGTFGDRLKNREPPNQKPKSTQDVKS